MAVQVKISKSIVPEDKDSKESLESPSSIITTNNLNAPKHGTVIPNRVFVGGISSATTEQDLNNLFSNYGHVVGTKIISDRAGVSKGYGFVTFETEDEAKRLQKDADNIVLRERRLNIAPAIKKQGFGRSGYECATPSPVPCASQIYRQNGVTFTYHNGMAFFPQPSPQTLPPSPHVEPSPVFQQGTSFSPIPQGSPGTTYPFTYAPQGQFLYQPPQYPYHVPQYDSCYDTSQVMVADGSLVVPQYYIASQPTHEITYFQPTPIHPPDASPSLPQMLYTSPRPYDSTVIYSTETKCGMENGVNNPNGGAIVCKEEADCSNNSTGSAIVTTTTTVANNATSTNNNHHGSNNHNNTNQRRARETTPVVSLNKLNNKESNYHHQMQHQQPRRKQYHYSDDSRRPYHLNNNNPDTTNRNLKHQQNRSGGENGGAVDCRRTPPPHVLSNSRPPPVQVPQYPYYHPRQVLAPPANLPSYYPPPPPAVQPLRSRSFSHRPRYGGGGGRGRGGKWITKEEEVGNPLTPPITPRSEPTGGRTTTAQQTEEVVQSMQTLTI